MASLRRKTTAQYSIKTAFCQGDIRSTSRVTFVVNCVKRYMIYYSYMTRNNRVWIFLIAGFGTLLVSAVVVVWIIFRIGSGYLERYYEAELEEPFVNISLLPMYGGVEKTEAQLKSDEVFIRSVLEEGVSREDASALFVYEARTFFEQGDLDTAMKRYNQAWLLNAKNPDVYTGFGDILLKQGDLELSEAMYQMARELK